jgi:transcriptional regulator with XRE-family HTH domain
MKQPTKQPTQETRGRPKTKITVSGDCNNYFLLTVNTILEKKGEDWDNLISKLNLSRSVVRNWMSEHRYPSLNNIYEIGQYLKVSPLSLLDKDTPFDLAKNNDYFKWDIMSKLEGKEPNLTLLAKAIGIPYKSLYNITKGTAPRHVQLKKIADYLGCSPLDFIIKK